MEMLNRDMEFYYNPFLLKGMRKALNRIVTAVNNKEKIIIYGYHDLDGITAISILVLVLKYLNADVEYFIPGYNECLDTNAGYIENYMSFLGADLIITVGCGMNFSLQVQMCKKLNIDIIITDYHIYNNTLPNATIINPNQKQCAYKFKDLSAAGIVYKLVEAISMYYHMQYINTYIDLVMIGTLSKGVSIKDENKKIIINGLNQLKYTNNCGLKALIRIYKISDINIKSVHRLINNILPSLNITKYINNPRIAVELFTTLDNDRAKQIAKYLKFQTKISNVCLY